MYCMRNPSRYTRPRAQRFSLKPFLPSNLFGRAFLIMVLPMVLSQLVIAHIFYDRHWSSVSRNLANSVVGDVVWLLDTYKEEKARAGRNAALHRTQALGLQMNIDVTFEPKEKETRSRRNKQFPELHRGLSERFAEPFAIHMDHETNQVHVRIYDGHGVLDLSMNRKMLTSPTTTIFLLWMIGSSLLLIMVATLFLRNQVKPIVQLAQAAEKLGLGQDVGDFKPRGASEVRRAGSAFLVMADRLRRHVQNRTEMLAGISHDLRTPLTRMTLEMELSQMSDGARAALTADIEEMRTMIDEYLDFARGDAGEIAEPIDVNLLLVDIVRGYGRSKRAVHYTRGAMVELMVRPQAVRRAITNLIDNALRYGGGVADITLDQSAAFVRIKITDQGPGIDDAKQEEVFKPFTRLETSRNTQTGGVGLGLSIARTIAQSHGGDVTLENQKDDEGNVTGLEVTLRLPRPVQ
jgi:two-component system osmolarity sensor histidine kinase EnvZ